MSSVGGQEWLLQRASKNLDNLKEGKPANIFFASEDLREGYHDDSEDDE